MVEYLSSSRINLYLLCSLKYKFHYVDKLPKPFKPSALAFGSAVHSPISWMHKEIMNGNEVTLEGLIRIFEADWYVQKQDTKIRYKDGETEMMLLIMAKEMLGLYFQNPIKEAEGSEVHFNVPLVDPTTGKELGVDLEGYFDLIEAGDSIVEFKTSAQTMNQAGVNDHLQLTAYSYAYEMIHRRPPKVLKIINFTKHKKPKMLSFETWRDKADHKRFFSLASQVLEGIKHQVFFPKQSFMCKDCEYAGPCREWGRN
jgi:putative RecB family exonuclease